MELEKSLSASDFPDLYKSAEPTGLDLAMEYWTPEVPGESKRVYFLGFSDVKRQEESGEERELKVAIFAENRGGEYSMIQNGSSRLIGIIGDNAIAKKTPLEITYKGKKKNKTNQYSSDDWAVKLLKVK